jgi:sarcosine oxidase subunit gamma
MADLTTLTGLRRSPLAHLTSDGEGRQVRLAERPFLTMVSVRVDPHGTAAIALERALGVELPRTAGHVAEHGLHHVLWLGPDEWLVVSDQEPATLVESMAAAVEGAHAAVVDVSANRTVLELTGPAARAVLAKGCPTDLHPRAFQPGMAVTTTLAARLPLLLWQVEPETYRLLPRSSFAEYVARWLRDAMMELA